MTGKVKPKLNQDRSTHPYLQKKKKRMREKRVLMTLRSRKAGRDSVIAVSGGGKTGERGGGGEGYFGMVVTPAELGKKESGRTA